MNITKVLMNGVKTVNIALSSCFDLGGVRDCSQLGIRWKKRKEDSCPPAPAGDWCAAGAHWHWAGDLVL